MLNLVLVGSSSLDFGAVQQPPEVFSHLFGDYMRLIEEIYIKATEDTICQTCGIDIPEGSNHLLETYVHQGALLSSHYCLNKKCNPPNNVKRRLWFTGLALLIGSVVVYLLLTESSPL